MAAALEANEERLKITSRERDMYRHQLNDMTRLWEGAVRERNRCLLSQKEAERLLIEVDARLHETLVRNAHLVKERDDAIERARMEILRNQLSNLEAQELERKRQRLSKAFFMDTKKRSFEPPNEADVRRGTSDADLRPRKRACTTPQVGTPSHLRDVLAAYILHYPASR